MIWGWILQASIYIGKVIIEKYISEKIKDKFNKLKHKYKRKTK